MEWNDFLQQQPAPQATADIQDDCLYALTSLSLIRIQGEDRLGFLHSQLTRDLHKLGNDQATLTAWCNPKGRVIATLILCRYRDHIDLLVASNLKDYIIKRLRMFVLRAQVTVEELSDSACIGISGEATGDLVEQEFPELHRQSWQCSHGEDMTAICLPGPVPRYLVYGPSQTLQKLWQQFGNRLTPTNESQWTLLNIEAGLPWIDHSVSEQFLPQMLNLEQIGGLDFNKGCYPGQEVIARLHYRGEVKQRLQRGLSPANSVEAGTALYNQQGERSGHIVNVAAGKDGQLHALAVATLGSEQLQIGDSNGPTMEFQA